MDEKIAWGQFNIPEAVFKGETVEDWYPISGKQGDEREGRMNLVISFTLCILTDNPQPVCANQVVYTPTHPSPMVIVSSQAPVPYGVPFFVPKIQSQVQPPPAEPIITENDVKLIKEMFPNVDTDVVNTILESNHGNKDASINALLQISSGN